MEPDRDPFGPLELDRDPLREIERDLDAASSQTAAAQELERSAYGTKERSHQPTCEDLVPLKVFHSPEREALDRLSADRGRPSRLHMCLAEQEQPLSLRRPQLDDDVKWEP